MVKKPKRARAAAEPRKASAAAEERMQNPVNQDLAGLTTDALSENIRQMGVVISGSDLGAIFKMARTALKEQGILGRKKAVRKARWATPEEWEFKLGDVIMVHKAKEDLAAKFISWAGTRGTKGFARVLIDSGDVVVARVLIPTEDDDEDEGDESTAPPEDQNQE